MIDLKKKCWREKVTAEITVAHMLQFARELGAKLSAEEAAAFLNEKGRAQAIWTHMMEAGAEFLKADLAGSPAIPASGRPAAQPAASANPLHRKLMAAERTPASYQ
jgi:hypothetical protein